MNYGIPTKQPTVCNYANCITNSNVFHREIHMEIGERVGEVFGRLMVMSINHSL